MKETTIVNIIAPAEGIEETRALAWQCMEQIFGVGSQGNSVMLPDALSPTGELPATHYLCSCEMSYTVMNAINEFTVANSVNVTVTEGETKEEFLARQGLTGIVG